MSATSRAKELRQSMTAAEKLLWAQFRDRRLSGHKFRRQHPIGPFIPDFYCAERHLVVELDGAPHDLTYDRDRARDAWLSKEGYRVMRFSNDEVDTNLWGVLETIRLALEQR
jgi:very-short-patch-repair endonuclease